MRRERLRATTPWLIVTLLVLVPLYAISIAFAFRSGIFDLRKTAITNEEYKAILVFIASGFATAATVVGLLFTRSHNSRTLAFQEDIENRKLLAQREIEDRSAILQGESESRLALDTVVKGLELIVNSNGAYAPRARIAGALAALVQLGHPVIAMRTMRAAWDDGAIDAGTVCWLIDEVFTLGSDESKREAGLTLLSGASKLTRNAGQFDWPRTVGSDWPQDLSTNTRGYILYAIVELLVSKDRTWWEQGTFGWWFFIPLLHEVRSSDKDSVVRDIAAEMLNQCFAFTDFENVSWLWKNETLTAAAVESDLRKHEYRYTMGQQARRYIDRLAAWLKGEAVSPSTSPLEPSL